MYNDRSTTVGYRQNSGVSWSNASPKRGVTEVSVDIDIQTGHLVWNTAILIGSIGWICLLGECMY